MIIEWLKIKVAPDLREKYIQEDEKIWTTALTNYPGFLGKEVWIDPAKPSEVVLVIHWADREAWKAVPASELEATEQRFAQVMGNGTYEMIEAGEYQVRKFPSRKLT